VAGCELTRWASIYAVPKLLKRNGLKMDDIDVWG
jgi:acetyl-CoA acetyltransferase